MAERMGEYKVGAILTASGRLVCPLDPMLELIELAKFFGIAAELPQVVHAFINLMLATEMRDLMVVHEVDERMLATEMRDLMPRRPDLQCRAEPYREQIEEWGHHLAWGDAWLAEFNILKARRVA